MRSRRSAGIAFGAAIAMVAGFAAPSVAAADASLRIEPGTIAVARGASFSVRVVQTAPVATSGAQASIDFDPAILQVVSVRPGPDYETAPIFLPRDLEADIRTANVTGHLAQVAAAYTPPDAVPAGTADFLVIRFQAVGCGQSDLRLPSSGPLNAQMISGERDAYGHEVPVAATTHGQVTTCAAAGAVTVDPTDPGSGAETAAMIPIPFIGAAGVIAVGLLGLLSWRMRRRGRPEDVAW